MNKESKTEPRNDLFTDRDAFKKNKLALQLSEKELFSTNLESKLISI